MRAAWLLAVLALACPAPASAQSFACAPHQRSIAIVGEVQHGQTFEQPFGGVFLFRLAASRDPGMPGWTIEIRRRGDTDPERELSWVVTPPYRGWSPRYIDTSYGKSAAEVAAITPREFKFLADPVDVDQATALVRQLLWPGIASTAELDAVRDRLAAIRTSRGQLHIHRATFGRGPGGAPHIAGLEFGVSLCD